MYYPPVRQPNPRSENVIIVNGESKIAIQPNEAEIQLGAEIRNQKLDIAQQESARVINRIIQSLIQLGIPQTNIQTDDYHIYPQYDFVDGNQQFRGYQVTHLLKITTDNLNQVGTIIDTAVQNGANRVVNIKFTSTNQEASYQLALKKALQNAAAKARTIANEMSLTLEPTPAKIIEQATVPPPLPYHTFTETGVVAGISTPIEPKQIEIEAKVQVKYYYK